MKLIGVKFIVSNNSNLNLMSLDKVFESGGYFIYELIGSNVGNYSPVNPIFSDSFNGSVEIIEREDFDPETQFVVNDKNIFFGKLNNVIDSRLIIEKGGFRVIATGKEHGVLILPIWFSNCMVVINQNDKHSIKLFRANLIQTGISFQDSIDISFKFKSWPFDNMECKHQDIKDTRVLLAP